MRLVWMLYLTIDQAALSIHGAEKKTRMFSWQTDSAFPLICFLEELSNILIVFRSRANHRKIETNTCSTTRGRKAAKRGASVCRAPHVQTLPGIVNRRTNSHAQVLVRDAVVVVPHVLRVERRLEPDLTPENGRQQ